MDQTDLHVVATRGELVEAIHPVSAAVVDADDRLLAVARDGGPVTWWRSAAKPFQALPMVQDGAADRFGLTDREIALACASHSSEAVHLEVIEGFLAKVGLTEEQLACGIHTPLSPAVAKEVARGTVTMTPKWSNCSGKHAGMLALARHHGWPLAGYNEDAHPVQQRIAAEISRWTDAPIEKIAKGVDGCAATCFGLPLRRMALAYARFGASREPAAQRILQAMMGHPELVGGSGRLCTDLMAAWPGRVMAKIGADGVYCAALPALGIGLALKVIDGDMRASGIALLAILRELVARLPGVQAPEYPFEPLAGYAVQPIRNTRGTTTGEFRAEGGLRFFRT
ncbi:MAG: asparaginase [Gemmatimonadales bacterium]|nr:asparaginase [Gemmatimonadales bacterium]